ncbi:MAG: energy-coupling factor ABC transporter permease [Desulfobulbaceae bacterium]|nr:energy-coupling factor ABC transporter permease [Desulfobulbaceae bacterium]
MHIPDGFLSREVCVVTSVISLATIGHCLHKTRGSIDRDSLLLMAAIGAFIFAAQMLNFPVDHGTSGHFLGSIFAAILLGPHLAILLVSLVLGIQMILFGDGGLMALGANIFNIGIISTLSGYFIYRLIADMVEANFGILVGTFTGSGAGIIGAAIACSLLLSLSNILPLPTLLLPMISVHVKIGVAEGLISLATLAIILKIKPDFFQATMGER